MMVALGITCRRHFEGPGKRSVDVFLPGLEPTFVGQLLEAIPGTDILADVATVQPTLKILCDLLGEFRVAQLNRGVRNTFIRVDYVGFGDSFSGTSVNAESATAAVVLDLLFVVFQIEV